MLHRQMLGQIVRVFRGVFLVYILMLDLTLHLFLSIFPLSYLSSIIPYSYFSLTVPIGILGGIKYG